MDEDHFDRKDEVTVNGVVYQVSTVELSSPVVQAMDLFLDLFQDRASGRYETMVFEVNAPASERWQEHYCQRYATEAEAEAGHAATVTALRAGHLDLY